MWQRADLCFIFAKAIAYEIGWQHLLPPDVNQRDHLPPHAPHPTGETDTQATCPLTPGLCGISGAPTSLHGAAVPREEGRAFSQGAESFTFSSSFIIL